MRKLSQKELLTEGFFDFIKKTKKAMSVIDPKATENLARPFQQTRDVYRSFVPNAASDASKKSSMEYISSSPDVAKKFIQKNPKIITKIASTEKNLYNREIDPSSITAINIKLPGGKAVQNLIIVSKDLRSPNKQPERYMYDKTGNFIKKL
jgi:hypothetical protein